MKILYGQKDEVIRDLQADLDRAYEDEAELDKQVTALLIRYGIDSTLEAGLSKSQMQQKVEKIGLLRAEVD